MRKVLFLMSHLGSGSNILYDSLNDNPQIQGFETKSSNIYISPLNVISLVNCRHKLNNSSAIYMDHLQYNYSFQIKTIYSSCKFIYVIREPIATINWLIQFKSYRPEEAKRYYLYRLRRICEMANKTPKACVLTYNAIKNQKGVSEITEYLDLIQSFKFRLNKNENENNELSNIFNEAEEAYEKYLFYLKKQDLKVIL